MNLQDKRGVGLLKSSLYLAFLLLLGTSLQADDGYRLWLRYDPLPAPAQERYRPRVTSIVVSGNSATLNVLREELVQGCSGLLGTSLATTETIERAGAVLVGTPKSSPLIAKLNWPLAELGTDGFRIRSVTLNGHAVTIIAANSDIGALYGAFHFLRLLQTEQPIANLNLSQKPRLQIRLLNHWDNLNGSIERGYAGRSLWDWKSLPDKVDGRLRDYARANASLGINGTAPNNVNANAQSLSAGNLRKTAAIANAFRPYGVRVFLSARFSAPMELGGLKTADPFDPEVAAWWKKKADEIYQLIPDFGGFLVKANSEGQPGPRTYNRNHVDGANMLAAVVAPHNGIVIWRAFVYDMKPGYDRAAAAYDNLQPFDGKFAPNVLLQVKNGPIDFQPR
jgi:alpha-glucuronidase